MAETVALAQLPHRAAVARLQLQVRQALEEALAAEARAARAVLSDETAVMQQTVADLMADGRAAFDRALEEERAAAAAAIAAAHLRAAGLPAAAPVATPVVANPTLANPTLANPLVADRVVATPGVTPTSPAAGAARATVAMLTMQLRAAEREADEVEARATGAELRAIADLRTHLAESIQQRAAELALALDHARADASAEIAAAHRAARRPVAALAAAEPAVSLLGHPATSLPDLVDAPTTGRQHVATPAVLDVRAAHVDVAPVAVPAVTPSSLAPEVFATMFASVLANMLDDRLPVGAAAAPPKPSFWAHARHPDVLLLGLATVIMLVILAAWLA